MSMIATDVATIPAAGFSWYILFLEQIFHDDLSKQLSENFITLGKEVGRDVLVIRGYDPNTFFDSAYETFTLYDDEWNDRLQRPGILVSDTAPALLLSEEAKLKSAKLIYLPLSSFQKTPTNSLASLLRQLVKSLNSPDAYQALRRQEPRKLSTAWGWLRNFVDLKPNFFGFGVDINAMIDQGVEGR